MPPSPRLREAQHSLNFASVSKVQSGVSTEGHCVLEDPDRRSRDSAGAPCPTKGFPLTGNAEAEPTI